MNTVHTNLKVEFAERCVRGPNLKILMPYASPGLTCEGLIKSANLQNLVVASNLKLGSLVCLQKPTSEETELQGASPFWSGTIFAYTSSGKKPGTEISYPDEKSGKTFIFPVPQGYEDKPDLLLLAEHPHYLLQVKSGKITVVAETVFVFENFPRVSFWYPVEPEHGIPLGGRADERNPGAGYLYRRNDALVSLVMRGTENQYLGIYPRCVHMDVPPSSEFGALVEKP